MLMNLGLTAYFWLTINLQSLVPYTEKSLVSSPFIMIAWDLTGYYITLSTGAQYFTYNIFWGSLSGYHGISCSDF